MEHKRIWIERDDECPYFYTEEELADASPPLVEYRIASSKGATVWRYIRPIAGTDPTIGYTENESLAREYEKFGPVDPLFPVERIAELERDLAAAQATIDMMAEAITELMYASTDKAHRMAHTALARRAGSTALDAMLEEARKEQAEQIIALAEHKAKRAQEYSDRMEEDDGEPDYHAEGIADGLLNLVREIRQSAERSGG